MQRDFLYILALAGIPLLGGCNKYLDVKPKGRLIPTEIKDFDHLLDNSDIVERAFLDNNLGCMLGYMTDNITLSEGLGKVNYKAFNHPNIDRYYGYIFRAPYKNPETGDYFWEQGTYGTMKYINNVIEGVKELRTSANESQANAVLAQAYTNRAWSYFNTALVYGPVYKPGGNNSIRSIPYLTDPDVSAAIPALSTQEEVFANVSADLHAALPYAPELTNYPSRPNKMATQAMLAYYHLFTQKYDSVVYYADLAWTGAIAKGGPAAVLYDYNALSYTEPSLPLISGIKSADNRIQLPSSREILFYRATDNFAGRTPDCYPSDEFIALFDQAADLRFKYFLLTAPGYQTTFNNINYNDGNKMQYYRGAPAGATPKFQMTSGFSYPELLLMRAEGYARTNKLPEAMADLNLLRKYRFVTGTADLAMPATQDAVIKLVLDERRRELPLGHIKRFMDLKRFCLEPGKPWGKTKITHTAGSETYEGTIDSPSFLLPISNAVLRFNPEWGIQPDTRPFN